MRKSTIAQLPTDVRDPGLRAPFGDALTVEAREHASGYRTTSVAVMRGDRFTVACTGHWGLAGALVKARLT